MALVRHLKALAMAVKNNKTEREFSGLLEKLNK